MIRADIVVDKHNLEAQKTSFGFWIYLMTDCVLFASLFASFVVLRSNTFGGQSGSEIFSMPYVLAETILLLASSFSCGLALLAARTGNKQATLVWLSVTFVLGAAFLGLEISEFQRLYTDGNSWQRSGFLSAYYTLVGTHGLHISVGLVWMAIMTGFIVTQGLSFRVVNRLGLLSLFWHFLDIIWIFIFSIVYLAGRV